jgi:hypothetical protein
MAEKATSVGYLPSTDPAAIEANRVYQEALARLNQSLDLRKNRKFDPMYLAAAQGFLAPTKTGSFTESLGRVAGTLGATQEQLIKEQQEESRQRLDVAGAGLELERLKQRDRSIGQFLGEGRPPAGGLSAPAASPVGGPAGGASAGPAAASPAGGLPTRPSAAEAGGLPNPPGFEGVQGVPTMPPNPQFLTGRDFIELNRGERGVKFPDLLKQAQEIDQKRYVAKEGGVQDMRSGLFFPFPKGEQAERQIDGKTYKVDSKTAALLDMYASSNDPRYYALAKRVVEGPTRPGEGKPQEGQPRKSQEELEIERKQSEALATGRGQTAAKEEADLPTRVSAARQMYGVAGRVDNALKESGNYFGIFQRPGIVPAIGKLVAEGVQTPGGTINLPGLQQAVTQALPGVTQKDLDNVVNAAADFAEVELLYRRLYLQGQGAVSNMEGQVVARLGGSVANSPGVLRARMQLLRERAQFDMDVGNAWGAFQDKSPDKSFTDFRRSSMYRDLLRGYEEKMGQLEKRLPALPTSQRPAATPARPSQQDLGTARQRLDSLLQGQ